MTIIPPSSYRPDPTNPPTGAQPLGRDQVAVKLLDLTPGLKDMRADTTLTGRIVEARSDGTVRIQTPSGDVTAQLPERVNATIGQRVDITLPQGSPPRDAMVAASRPVPPSAPPQTDAPLAPPDPAASVPRAGNTPTPVDDQLRQMATTRAEIDIAPAPPQLDQMVRVQPVSPAQARVMVQQIQQNMQQTLLQLVDGPMATNMNLTGTPVPPSAVIGTPIAPGSSSGPMNTGNQIPPLQLFDPIGLPAPTPLMAPPATSDSLTALALPQTDGIIPVISDELITPMSFAVPGKLQALVARITALDLTPLPLLIKPDAVDSPSAGSIMTFSARPTSSADTLSFMVTAVTSQGHVLLQRLLPSALAPATDTPDFYVLQIPAGSLPIGARITLQPVATLPGQSAPDQGLALLAPQLIDDLYLLLQALPDEMAHAVFGAAARPPLPTAQAPQQMGAAVLFFLAALRSGDLGSWLGDRAVDALRRAGKGNILDRLGDTMDAARQTLSDKSSGEWRSYVLPFQFQQDIKPALLHIKHRGDNDEQQDKQHGGQRFVIDVTLDRMGAVQLDLLYRPGELNTILRTELPVSRAMAAVMAEKYAGAMGQTQLTGQLLFQHGPKGWVTIDEIREGFKTLA